MSNIKILYIISKPNVGGLQTSTRNRINALKMNGIEAEIMFFETADGEYLFKNITHYYVRNANEFREKILLGGYDVISFIYTYQYIENIPEEYTGKVLYEVRGWSNAVISAIEKISELKKVDAFLCIAKYLKTLVEEITSQSVPVFIEGNVVDSMFRYIPPDSINLDFKPKKDHRIMAFVGRVENSKNWKEFMSICHLVSKKNNIEIWFICNPNTSKCLEEMIERSNNLNLNNITRVIPNVPNEKMPEIYSIITQSGGCVVSSSKREGIGNAILEPMSCGCPVVSSDVPGKNEVIIHGHNGLLYKSKDIEEATKNVEQLILNEDYRNRLIDNAFKTIEKNFKEDIYISRYLNILSLI